MYTEGIGVLDLTNDDEVCFTNVSRQIYVTRKTIGKYQVEVAKERIPKMNGKFKGNECFEECGERESGYRHCF